MSASGTSPASITRTELDKCTTPSSYDAILGAGYTRGKWTYTAGGVYMNKASTDNPVEWGQDNTAMFLNLGIYRDLPELSFAKFQAARSMRDSAA